jgi:diguanylate cyclase (GGDEF)-like protein
MESGLPPAIGSRSLSHLNVYPSISSDHAVELAERIRSSIADHPIAHEGQGHQISVSIGVAGTDNSRVISPTDLLRFADRALYDAKSSGRNKVSVWI